MIRPQFFHTGALHLFILFIGFTSVDLKILSSSSDDVEIVSVVLPTPVYNSLVFTVVISRRKQRLRTKYQFDNPSYLRLLLSTLCSPWSYLLFPDSLILIRYETPPAKIFVCARSIFMFMCLIIDSRESMIIDQKQCSLQQKICIWSDYYRPLIYS